MKATLFINGYRVGELDYEHPKDAEGRAIVLPSNGAPSFFSVHIEGGERRWIGSDDLIDISR